MRKYLKKILFWGNLVFAISLLISYLANFISPAGFWHIAFFGLAYSVLLIINVGFAIFWLWRRRFIAIVSLLPILMGIGYVGRYIQLKPIRHKVGSDNSIKLLTYNVRLFNLYGWEKGVGVSDSILNYVKRQKADVVCFQEFLTIYDHYKRSEAYIDSSLAEYPDKHIHYNFKSHRTSEYGIATFSKYPIIRRVSIKFKDSYNICIYSDIAVSHDTIRVFNVHLQSIKLRKNNYNFVDSLIFRFNAKRINEVKDISGRLKQAYIKRAKQVDELNYHIKQSPYPVIVCGDFNDTPVSYTYQKIRGNMTDAFMSSGKWIGNTYRGNFPSFRIDFIFHSKELNTIDYNSDHINLSDHYPINCTVDLQGNR
ncbi:MAG: endonuclease/exonuclease/phosphatase family protein [Bacteroidales bacterium]|nr:endonuclease/exonuclease/phosphatase family protein [Bacteroidales bacterium]